MWIWVLQHRNVINAAFMSLDDVDLDGGDAA